MPMCSIIDCGARKNADLPQLSHHRFPNNEILCKKWLNIIGSENINTKHKVWFVCSKHFEEKCINKSLKAPRLINGALPSLLLKTTKARPSPKLDPIVTKMESNNADIQHNIKLCRACLRTDCKLFPIQRYKLTQAFTQVTKTTFNETDRLPQDLCIECISCLEKMRKFQIQAKETRTVLNLILKTAGLISPQAVLKIGKVSSGLSVKHLGSDHYDASFNEEVIVKIEPDYDYLKVNDNEDVFVEVKVVSNNLVAIGQDDKESIVRKVAPLSGSDDECDEDKIYSSETDEDKETVKDEGTFRHVELSDIKTLKHESTVQNVEMIENNEIIEQFDQDNQSDCESEISNDSKHASGIERLRESSTANRMDKLKIIDKFREEIAKDRKKINSNMIGSIKTDPTLKMDEYFTLKLLSTKEQIECMEKRKTNRKFSNCPIKCEFCCKGFADDSKYKLHMANHSELPALQQEWPDEKKRQRNSSERGTFVCGVCKYRFANSNKLRSHIIGSHQRLFACKKCDYQTNNKGTAMNHARLHKGKIFECAICKTKYRTKQTYLSHKRLSHPSGHVCALCASTFVNETGLKMHMRLKHTLDNRPIPEDGPVCDVCDVKFVSQDVLATHKWTSHRDEGRTGDTPMRTPATRLDMIVSRALGVPNEIGRPRKPRERKSITRKPAPPCSECGKQFPSSQSLFAHLRRMHPNSAALLQNWARRSFLCDVCGKRFSISTQLKEHRVLHTLGRLPCDQCDRSYETVMGLLEHKRSVHQGITYPCSICNMTFSNYANRRRHEKYVHRTTKTEACDICGKTFKCAASKYNHTQHVHFNKPWPVRKRDRASERKRQRPVQNVTVEESGESPANGSEQGLGQSQAKHSEGKRKRLEEADTDDDWSE